MKMNPHHSTLKQRPGEPFHSCQSSVPFPTTSQVPLPFACATSPLRPLPQCLMRLSPLHQNRSMAIHPDIRHLQARDVLRPRLEVAIPLRPARVGNHLAGPRRDEADPFARRVGRVTKLFWNVARIGRAGVHAGCKVGCEEGEERRVGRVAVAVPGEFEGAEDWKGR